MDFEVFRGDLEQALSRSDRVIDLCEPLQRVARCRQDIQPLLAIKKSPFPVSAASPISAAGDSSQKTTGFNGEPVIAGTTASPSGTASGPPDRNRFAHQ